MTALERQLLEELEKSEQNSKELYNSLRHREKLYTEKLEVVTSKFMEETTRMRQMYEASLNASQVDMHELKQFLEEFTGRLDSVYLN